MQTNKAIRLDIRDMVDEEVDDGYDSNGVHIDKRSISKSEQNTKTKKESGHDPESSNGSHVDDSNIESPPSTPPSPSAHLKRSKTWPQNQHESPPFFTNLSLRAVISRS